VNSITCCCGLTRRLHGGAGGDVGNDHEPGAVPGAARDGGAGGPAPQPLPQRGAPLVSHAMGQVGQGRESLMTRCCIQTRRSSGFSRDGRGRVNDSVLHTYEALLWFLTRWARSGRCSGSPRYGPARGDGYEALMVLHTNGALLWFLTRWAVTGRPLVVDHRLGLPHQAIGLCRDVIFWKCPPYARSSGTGFGHAIHHGHS
jgi:hypothetical protein